MYVEQLLRVYVIRFIFIETQKILFYINNIKEIIFILQFRIHKICI
ncbi:hypothetical protein FHW74_002059 [Atlantibacter sp. RC6]|nr:hypothetical protein [Atlantibacter sp. RC6]